MHRIRSQKLIMGVCGIAAVGMLAATQGCSSSSSSGGTGGGGGSTGVGGHGGAGQGGTGQDASAADSGPPLCTGIAPTNTSISDFTPDGGTSGVSSGGVYTYAATDLTAPAVVTSTGSLVATIATGPVTTAGNNYAGFGISFNACTDASTYSGVKFNISGTLSTGCTIQFSATFSEDAAPSSTAPVGRDSCTGSCYPPSKIFALPATATDVTVNFADVTGGAPLMVIDKARLTGIQWQLNVPATTDAGGGCTGSVTIDNVVFVP
jgi:hypothetical protein